MKDYELIKKCQNGDEESLNEFINKNMKLVYSIVHRFHPSYQDQADLIQVALVALMKAIQGFDFTYEVAFSTYAVPYMLGDIKHYLRNSNKIHLTRKMKELYYHINKAKDELMQIKNREVSYQEIADYLHIEYQEVITCLEANQVVLSIDELQYNHNGDSVSLDQFIADTSNHNHTLLINQLMKYLNHYEQMLIIYHYQYGYTQSEIAHKLNISQVQVSRLIKKALEKMKNHL